MKKKRLILLLFAILLGPLVRGGNPYDIDDDCYTLLVQIDTLLGQPGFNSVAERFLNLAVERGDRKAETLYYVESMKNLTNTPRNRRTADWDDRIDAAFQKLRAISLETGYKQYYYFAYQLAQNYYYNEHQREKTFRLVEEMTRRAVEEDDEYGMWVSYRYLATLYLALSDYVSAKENLRKSLDIFEKTDDPTIKRQSVARLYFDLSDTFPVGSDSMRFFIQKGLENARIHQDSIRYYYYDATLGILDRDRKHYERSRDICLADGALRGISSTARQYFYILDGCLEGDLSARVGLIDSLGKTRERRFIANAAENWGYKEEAFGIEKDLVTFFEHRFSEVNASRLSELDVELGKVELAADLERTSQQIYQVTRLVAILIAVLLAGALGFSWLYIRNLREARRKDEERIAELKAANEKVRLADAAKTRFVQNMSHEVRTPLNAIVGFSQLLSLPDGSFPPEEKDEFAGHIVNNTKMLTMLLDDILNASAMDSGNYRISYEEGEMHFICQAAISSAEHRLQPGVRMYYVPGQEAPFRFRTDPRRVQQILINLLTNACKHTTQGEIRLSSSLEEHPGEVTFAVTDTGPGVPAEQAEKIFDRFTKLNEFVQGTGLGLSICRDIAGRMGGRVYLDTGYTAGGARFVFTVPVTPPADAAPPTGNAPLT